MNPDNLSSYNQQEAHFVRPRLLARLFGEEISEPEQRDQTSIRYTRAAVSWNIAARSAAA